MATILWHQTYNGEDKLISNTDKNTSELVNVLSKYSELAIETEELKEKRRDGYDISSGIKYLCLKEVKNAATVVFIQSFFKERDKYGRRLSFMFYTDDCTGISDAASLLNNWAKEFARKTCSTDEIEYFESVDKFPMKELWENSITRSDTLELGALLIGLGVLLLGNATKSSEYYFKKSGLEELQKIIGLEKVNLSRKHNEKHLPSTRITKTSINITIIQINL
ncbi:MAG: hypothetical protein J6U21_14050 [Bacteroidales bacterium]|nr:hypothetical protein [Bacteroidales bacterium]